jgi:hypothetical protein
VPNPEVVTTAKTSLSVVFALPVTLRSVTVQPKGIPTRLEKLFNVPGVVSWFLWFVCRLKICVDGVNAFSVAENDRR